ncbi:MAG: ATP-binding protein [Patescibacteria group bacterium]
MSQPKMRENSSKYNWYVVTGGPSSGKTTVLKELERRGYIIFPEAARLLIDEEMGEGKTLEEIRSNEAEFQKRVLKKKLEIEKKAPRDKIIFFDRAIPDSIAYYQLCGLKAADALKFCKKGRYKKVFLFEQLSFIRDYARNENDRTVKKLNRLLEESYKRLNYKIIRVPVASVDKRVKRILEEIEAFI